MNGDPDNGTGARLFLGGRNKTTRRLQGQAAR